MGVPKFYRWVSERYPCLSEVVKEYQIPEFDNLYLDMNGIIHVCSHPNDDDPHFRMSEDKIFSDIFHYIEFLFLMIKPRKVFFMAVDGVAPRAKMNQQRGRRFRSAKDAEILEKKAIEKGEVLPKESRFDSNCITPGTSFMCRLHEQLKFFVALKLSTDSSWRECNVYLSGHETPGEGEHKIMDFIRHQRSQPGYDPNTRHCLYGLDADLMMLGLCSHEPHFSLLREEVKYGKDQNRPVVPEQTTFHLLHLSLMREYLDHEFSALKTGLQFEYDIEKIIDDWVLMGFLVGNDFIPNLPHLHIASDALPVLYRAYIEVLPTLGGYINEAGYLNLERFQKYIDRVSKFDFKTFSDNQADFKFMNRKRSKRNGPCQSNDNLLEDLGKFEEKYNNIPGLRVDAQLANLFQHDDEEEEDDDDEYDDLEEEGHNSNDLCRTEFLQHKRDYYMNKLDYANVTEDVMKEQAYEYVRAIQWNLHYYYNGVVSWSWYYPHHYAPYISDVKNFSEIDLHFELGSPFLPFEQLLAVLPVASKALLPEPFQRLMCSENSPVKSFYPEDFKTDLNGKKQEWEAVVLLPFINEELLLESMKMLEDELTDEEKRRNGHGPHLLYTYSRKSLGRYDSTLTAVFPDIKDNHGKSVEIDLNFFRLPTDQIVKGLCDGVQLDVFFPGFPTLKHVKHKAVLKNEKVKVFQQVSRNQNMMLIIETDEQEKPDLNALAKKLLGRSVYVNWPHLTEARVIAISDANSQIVEDEPLEMLTKSEKDVWKKQMKGVQTRYYERFGVETGDISCLIHATILTGIRYAIQRDSEMGIEKQWSNHPTPFAVQAVVQDLSVHTPSYQRFKTLEEFFPVGSVCFLTGRGSYYGLQAEVLPAETAALKNRVRVKVRKSVDPNLDYIPHLKTTSSLKYMPGYALAQKLGISSYLLSRITGTVYIQTSPLESISPNKSNIGLNLKFNKKNEEIPGYSKKQEDGTWIYSNNALNVMKDYLKKFPELVEKLVKLVDQDVILVDDIFPDGNGREYIHNVCSWLKSLPCANIPRQSCGASALDEAVVQEIEAALNKAKENLQPSTYTILQVNPRVLFRPVTMQAPPIPDPSATYELYDRVVNVREGWVVPLGLCGVVIGIHTGDKPEDITFDVVFDEEFSGGLALNCSPKRGYRMSLASLINISYGKRTGKKNHIQQPESSASKTGQKMQRLAQPQDGRGTDKTSKSPSKKSGRNELPPRLQAARQNQNHHSHPPSSSYSSPGTSNEKINRFNHSPDSPFVPHAVSWGPDAAFSPPPVDERQSFVTPKVLPRNVQYREELGFFRQPVSEVPTTPPKKSTPVQEKSEYQSIWEGLKQSPFSLTNGQPPPPPQPHQHVPAVTYGRPLSVEELFRGAAEVEVQETQKIRKPEPPTKRSAVTELMQYVSMQMGGGVPVYRYTTVGPRQFVQAEVTLPNGFKCSSGIASNQMLASENAAEQALAILAGNAPVPFGAHIRPPMPQPFSSASASPKYPMPPANLMPNIIQPVFPGDMNSFRHPGSQQVNTIPDSFVAYNQLLAQSLQPRGAGNHRMTGPPPRPPLPQWSAGPPQQPQPRSMAPVPTNEMPRNAVEFIPTQVSRKQAGKASKVHSQQNSQQDNTVGSVSNRLESLSVSSQERFQPTTHQEAASSSTRNNEETTAPRQKRKSRLAVKFRDS